VASQATVMSASLIIQPSEAHADRWWVESRKLRAAFPDAALVGADGRVTGAVATLTTNVGGRYGIRVDLRGRYPHHLPSVFPRGWSPVPLCPHLYTYDTGPALCVLHPRRWSSRYTVAYLLTKAALWLNKYEVWQVTGRWPGRDAHHTAHP